MPEPPTPTTPHLHGNIPARSYHQLQVQRENRPGSGEAPLLFRESCAANPNFCQKFGSERAGEQERLLTGCFRSDGLRQTAPRAHALKHTRLLC